MRLALKDFEFEFAGKIYHFAEGHRAGATQVLPWLWLGGEEDVDEPLYGKLLKPEHVTPHAVSAEPKVHLWIDFRHDTPFNRKIYVPPSVAYIAMPFRDGDLEKAGRVLPLAKTLLDRVHEEGKSALISCHAGVSRSAVLALWCMAEERDYEWAWRTLLFMRPHVAPHPVFEPILSELARSYPAKDEPLRPAKP